MITPRTRISPHDVARHYDDLDLFYRELWGEHVHHGYWRTGREQPSDAAVAMIDRVASRLGLAPGEHVCDVGCGYGGTIRHLATTCDVTISGVTVSPKQAALARAATVDDPRCRVLLMDWLANGFADASFDAVVAIESSEHMASLTRFFGEAFRTLRPGGRIAACVWLSREAPSPWQVRHLLEPICREGRLARLATAEEYIAGLRRAGFVSPQWEDISPSVSRTWTICLGRLAHALATNRLGARRFLMDRSQSNRVFAATAGRIRLAFAVGALRYGVFSARKPQDPAPRCRDTMG